MYLICVQRWPPAVAFAVFFVGVFGGIAGSQALLRRARQALFRRVLRRLSTGPQAIGGLTPTGMPALGDVKSGRR